MKLVFEILWTALIIGGLARFAVPGPDPMPLWLTLTIGLIGAIAGAGVGRATTGGNSTVAQLVAFVVAIALVAAYRVFVQKRAVFGREALRFPERGVGVEGYRERLRKMGVDPDNMQPARPQAPTREDRLRGAIDELRRSDLIDEEEQERLFERLAEHETDTKAP